jgi:pyruvate dehydrogenase E2 component (dihydrolipoamide acetyltransferase)
MFVLAWPRHVALLLDSGAATRAGVSLAAAEVTSVVPMIGLRRVVAQRMFQSARTVPRVTHTTEADVTETVRMRQGLVAGAESRGEVRPSYTDIIVKIVAQALREHPRMNARLAEEQVQLLEDVNVGVAVAVPEGLTVPVIHGADSKSIKAIAHESRDKIERARAGTLANEDLTGGTFTVTNLGTYEIDAFTPIINLPEAAILGVGRIVEKPAVVDGQITVRSMMYLSLTFDHRIIDGAPAAAFLRTVKGYLEQPYELLAVR